MGIRVVIEPDNGYFIAYCPELPGCVTYAESEKEAKAKIQEAIELYLRPAPLELSKQATVFEVPIG